MRGDKLNSSLQWTAWLKSLYGIYSVVTNENSYLTANDRSYIMQPRRGANSEGRRVSRMWERSRQSLKSFFDRPKNNKNSSQSAQPRKEAAKMRECPTRSFRTFFDHLKNDKNYSPATCIDVGAASGTLDIYDAFPKAHHIVFEPLPDFHQALKRSLTPYSHEIHHCALMEEPGEKVLLRHADKYGSSMMHKLTGQSSNLVPVQVDTLDNVIGERDFSGGLLIKTDCQGADLFVIKGGLETLKKADVVIIEASMFRFWGAHHPDFYDIIHYMKERSFVLYDVLDGLFRPLDNALGQLDLVFVKEDGRFREDHVWQARRA